MGAGRNLILDAPPAAKGAIEAVVASGNRASPANAIAINSRNGVLTVVPAMRLSQ